MGNKRKVIGIVNITLVTDPNSGYQAVYYNGKLLIDLGDNCNSRQDLGYETLGDLLELLCDKLQINFEYYSGYQVSRKIEGIDYTEWEGYWPDYFTDVPLEKGWDSANI